MVRLQLERNNYANVIFAELFCNLKKEKYLYTVNEIKSFKEKSQWKHVGQVGQLTLFSTGKTETTFVPNKNWTCQMFFLRNCQNDKIPVSHIVWDT